MPADKDWSTGVVEYGVRSKVVHQHAFVSAAVDLDGAVM